MQQMKCFLLELYQNKNVDKDTFDIVELLFFGLLETITKYFGNSVFGNAVKLILPPPSFTVEIVLYINTKNKTKPELLIYLFIR